METPVKNLQKYRKTVKNNKKLIKNRQNIKKPAKISKKR